MIPRERTLRTVVILSLFLWYMNLQAYQYKVLYSRKTELQRQMHPTVKLTNPMFYSISKQHHAPNSSGTACTIDYRAFNPSTQTKSVTLLHYVLAGLHCNGCNVIMAKRTSFQKKQFIQKITNQPISLTVMRQNVVVHFPVLTTSSESLVWLQVSSVYSLGLSDVVICCNLHYLSHFQKSRGLLFIKLFDFCVLFCTEP